MNNEIGQISNNSDSIKDLDIQNKENGFDSNKNPEKAISFDRLQSIIRSISGHSNLVVTSKVDPQTLMQRAMEGRDARNEWFKYSEINKKTKKVESVYVHVPENIVEKENVAKGKAAHEAGHVAITRYGEFIPDEVMQETGFSSMMAKLEERPTDQVVRDRYPGAGKWVDEARRDSIKDASYAVKGSDELGYIPKFGQLCDLFVYEPHFNEIPSIFDKDVLELYDKLKDSVAKIEHTLPEEKASEEKVYEHAAERYRLAYSEIWPEIKSLVEKDSETENLRQMVEQALENKNNPSAQNEKPNPLEELPQELLDELMENINKVSEEMIKDLIEKLENSIGESNTPDKENTDDVTNPAEIPPKIENESPENKDENKSNTRIPMNKLSDELLKTLKEIFDNLPENEKNKIREGTKIALEKLEDDVTNEIEGKLVEMKPESHSVLNKKKEIEENELQGKILESKIKDKLIEIEKMQASMQKEKNRYDKAYEEVRIIDEILYRRLKEILTPNIKKKATLKSSGTKLNLPAVYKWKSGKAGGAAEVNNKIFETIHFPDKKDYAITLLVDLSGSMAGSKINETFKGVVLIGEVLNRLGIKSEILGFQDKVIEFKDFNQKIDDKIRKKITGMIDEVYQNNPGGNNYAINDDGPCLAEASRRLGNEPGKQKFLMVFSDGQPNGRYSGEQALRDSIKNINKNTDQNLIAVGLGRGTEFLKDYYPVSLPNISVDHIPDKLGDILEDVIKNPNKYANEKY